jgi:hypothetical protein
MSDDSGFDPAMTYNHKDVKKWAADRAAQQEADVVKRLIKGFVCSAGSKTELNKIYRSTEAELGTAKLLLSHLSVTDLPSLPSLEYRYVNPGASFTIESLITKFYKTSFGKAFMEVKSNYSDEESNGLVTSVPGLGITVIHDTADHVSVAGIVYDRIDLHEDHNPVWIEKLGDFVRSIQRRYNR